MFVFAITSSPLDWSGPGFLGFYAVALVVATLLALCVRFYLASRPEWSNSEAIDQIRADEAACLDGGPRRAIQAAMTRMLIAGHLRIATADDRVPGLLPSKRNPLIAGDPLPADASQLEYDLYAAAVARPGHLEGILAAGMPAAETIEQRLIDRGWRSHRGYTPQIVSAIIVAMPLVFALAKIWVGWERDKPVELIWFGCAFNTFLLVAFLISREPRTTTGDDVLQRLREHYEPIQASYQKDSQSGQSWTPELRSMMVGLFGLTMLAHSPFSAFMNLPIWEPKYGTGDGGGGETQEASQGGGCGGCNG